MCFEPLNLQNTTAFYTKENLSEMKFSEIYNIFILSTYIIFVDNNKLVMNVLYFFEQKDIEEVTQKISLLKENFVNYSINFNYFIV